MKFTFTRTVDGQEFVVHATTDKTGTDTEVEYIFVNGGQEDAHGALRRELIDYLHDAAQAEAYAAAEDTRCHYQEYQRELAFELHHS